MRPLPTILCVDVEPDGRTIDPRVPAEWRGFAQIIEPLDELRAAASGSSAQAHLTWLLRMDPQIAMVYGSASWAAERYAPAVESIRRKGDAVGLHLHPWRWIEESGEWIQDFADRHWLDHCLDTSFQAYQRRFGTKCAIFRFGDRWMDNRTLRSLIRRGVRYDLTLEPGPVGWTYPLASRYRWRFPDCSAAPRQPYKPSAIDFRLRGRVRPLPIWMIPVSTTVAAPRSEPEVANSTRAAISIDPVVSLVDDVWDRAAVTVSWHADVPAVDIRIDAPDGVLFAGGGSEGSLSTGNWVSDGMRFYLQDPRTSATLAVATAAVRSRRDRRTLMERWISGRGPVAVDGEWSDLNIGCDAGLLERLLEKLLGEPDTRHLVLIARTDAGLEENSVTLQRNIALVADLARSGTIALVSPEEVVRALQPRNGGSSPRGEARSI
jgi:hypothetical protein